MCDSGDENGVERTMAGWGGREEAGPFCSDRRSWSTASLERDHQTAETHAGGSCTEVFEYYVSQLEGRIREGDQFGFYKHLKGMDVERNRAFNSQYIIDEKGRLLRDNVLIRERWVRWFHEVLNTKSTTFEPSIVDELKQWPPCRPLGDVPYRYEVEEAINALANRKAVGPDGLPAELLKVLAD